MTRAVIFAEQAFMGLISGRSVLFFFFVKFLARGRGEVSPNHRGGVIHNHPVTQ